MNQDAFTRIVKIIFRLIWKGVGTGLFLALRVISAISTELATIVKNTL